jgi:hypothetical protein
MTDETDQPTVRYYLSDDYGSDEHGPLTALVAEKTGGGHGTHTRAIAFKANLDHIHPVLWPTLLAQYGLAEPPTEKYERAARVIIDTALDLANEEHGHRFPAATSVDHDLARAYEQIADLVEASMRVAPVGSDAR